MSGNWMIFFLRGQRRGRGSPTWFFISHSGPEWPDRVELLQMDFTLPKKRGNTNDRLSVAQYMAGGSSMIWLPVCTRAGSDVTTWSPGGRRFHSGVSIIASNKGGWKCRSGHLPHVRARKLLDVSGFKVSRNSEAKRPPEARSKVTMEEQVYCRLRAVATQLTCAI